MQHGMLNLYLEKDKMHKESYELSALISKLRLGDDEMSIKTYIQMEGKDITKLELSIDELVDVALGINYAQAFDLNVVLHSVNVDDVAPPTIKLVMLNVIHHCRLIFLLKNVYFGVSEIITFIS